MNCRSSCPRVAPSASRGRELALPAFGAGEQQVGEVGAGDEQHEADRRLQHPDGAAGAADNLFLIAVVAQRCVF